MDFVDIDPARDLRVFLDPYFLSKRTDPWSIEATKTVKSFFQHFLDLLRSGREEAARELFSNFGEPNETCLGLSKGKPQGHGVGDVYADKLFLSLKGSKAVQTGLVEHLEDTRVFVRGFGKDLTSDMTTNIIRGHLLRYTQTQCSLWEIPLQSESDSGAVWDRVENGWISFHTDRLIVRGKPLLLVPKGVVSYASRYSAGEFHRHHALNFLKHEHLKLDTAFVQRRMLKSGGERRWVTKKSISDPRIIGDDPLLLPFSKERLARFTQRYPEIFKEFKQAAIEKIQSLDDRELTTADRNAVIDHLIAELQSIPSGQDQASKYHKTIMGILELLLYPDLIAPQKEKEIYQGRKRIDITFDNAARSGFFWFLPEKNGIFCPYVAVECKNYSDDVSNEEVDQLAGRFSTHHGRVGLLVSRSIDDLQRLMDRCADTYSSGRGVIIPLFDEDIVTLLRQLQQDVARPWDTLFTDRFRKIAMR